MRGRRCLMKLCPHDKNKKRKSFHTRCVRWFFLSLFLSLFLSSFWSSHHHHHHHHVEPLVKWMRLVCLGCAPSIEIIKFFPPYLSLLLFCCFSGSHRLSNGFGFCFYPKETSSLISLGHNLLLNHFQLNFFHESFFVFSLVADVQVFQLCTFPQSKLPVSWFSFYDNALNHLSAND